MNNDLKNIDIGDLKNVLKYNEETDYFGFTYNGTYYDILLAGLKGLYLLNDGAINTDYTLLNKITHSGYGSIATFQNGEIYTYAAYGAAYCFWYMDLTEYSTLKIVARTSVDHLLAGVFSELTYFTSVKYVNLKETNYTEYTFDISEISGNYYVGIYGHTSDTSYPCGGYAREVALFK